MRHQVLSTVFIRQPAGCFLFAVETYYILTIIAKSEQLRYVELYLYFDETLKRIFSYINIGKSEQLRYNVLVKL